MFIFFTIFNDSFHTINISPKPLNPNPIPNTRTAVSKFEVSEIVFDRSSVDTQLRIDLNAKLSEEGATVDNFQLLEIDFPAEYEKAISDTQNEQLKIDIAKNEQNKTIEELEGLKNKVETEKEIIKTNYLVSTINDVTLIKQNTIALNNFVGAAGTYLGEKVNVYGIQELAKAETEAALRKSFGNGGNDDRYPYLIQSPATINSLITSA